MEINKSELLSVLDIAKIGTISQKDKNNENYFYFSENNIVTFNEKISIQIPFKTDFSGFVKSSDFYKLISKINLKKFTLERKEDKIILKDKTVNISIPIINDEEILERIKNVQKSVSAAKGNWSPLIDNFMSSIELCSFFSSTQESDRTLTCVCVSENKCISSDNSRIAYAKLDTEIEEDILIKASEIKSLSLINPVELSITKSWLHFRNSENVIVSLLKINGEFPSFIQFFDFEGETIKLPENITEGIDITEIFSDESDPTINVKISNNTMILSVMSESGNAKYRSKIKYSGKDVQFSINPEFLKQVIKYSSVIVLSKDRLKIETDSGFSMITALYGE